MPEATADSETIRAIQATTNTIESREWLRETDQLTESVDPLPSLKRLTDPIVDYAYMHQLNPRALCEYLRTGEQRLFDGALDDLHRIAADVRYRDAHERTSPAQGDDGDQRIASIAGDVATVRRPVENDELIDANQAAKLWHRSASWWRNLFGNEIKQRGTGKNGAKLCWLRDVARYAEDHGIQRR